MHLSLSFLKPQQRRPRACSALHVHNLWGMLPNKQYFMYFMGVYLNILTIK